MNKRAMLVKGRQAGACAVLATVVLVTAGGTLAVAARTSNTLQACSNKSNGALRLASKCKKDERQVSWNITGQVGPPGINGRNGAPGPRGGAGAVGPTGPKGDTGLRGPTGIATVITRTTAFSFRPNNGGTGQQLDGVAWCNSGESVVGGGTDMNSTSNDLTNTIVVESRPTAYDGLGPTDGETSYGWYALASIETGCERI